MINFFKIHNEKVAEAIKCYKASSSRGSQDKRIVIFSVIDLFLPNSNCTLQLLITITGDEAKSGITLKILNFFLFLSTTITI